LRYSAGDLVRDMKDYRAATLPVALIAIIGAGLFVFLELAEEVREAEMLDIDRALLLFMRDPGDLSQPIGPRWLEQTMIEITALGGYPILSLLVAMVVGFLLISRRYGSALYVTLSICLGTLAGHVLKLLYERPRPDLVDHLVDVHTASFPSGHATMSAIVYLTLAALIMRLANGFAVRLYVLFVAVFLTLAIGTSRVYLGVHWPSDVVAGWALGAAWASVSWLAVSALRAYRHRTRSAPNA
jgi:undecaprenyl-diphosphatase